MKISRWLLALAGVAISLAAAAGGWRWYAAASILKVAVAPGGDALRPFLHSLVSHQGKVAFELIAVGDNAAALKALREGRVQLASVRVDEGASGDIRAVAVLSGRYLVQAEAATHADPDLMHVRDRLAETLGKPMSLSGIEARAARRLERAPKGLITRSSLKMSEEQADRVWRSR